MEDIKNIRIELQIVSKKPDWFLDHLKLMDILMVFFISTVTLSSIYFRLGLIFPIITQILVVAGYVYMILFSKNYRVNGTLTLDESGVKYNSKSYSWTDEKVIIIYKGYKNYLEWPYKQITSNTIDVGGNHLIFLMELKQLEDLKALKAKTEGFELKNLRSKSFN